MTRHWETILARHGQQVVLTRRGSSESTTLYAFLQPILKQRQQPPAAVTPLGAVSEQRWLYLGSARTAIAPGDHIQTEALRLTVQEVQGIYMDREFLYYWALLRPEREAVT